MNMINRESRIWRPFQFVMPSTEEQRRAKAMVFGMYANAYRNGLDYMQAYKEAELEMIVADYDQKMAALSAEEQKAIFDILTRRYLSSIDRAVHDAKIEGMREQVDDDSAMMDARFESLEADWLAVETLRVRLEQQERLTEARIQVLKAQLAQEEANRKLADIDIANREIDVARKETESAGMDVSLANKDLEIARAELSKQERETRLLGQDVEIEQKDLQISRAELEKQERDLRVVRAGHDILRTQMGVIEAGIKEIEHRRDLARMDIDKANTEAQIARTEQIRVQEREAALGLERARAGIKETEIRGENVQGDIARTRAQLKEMDLERLKTDQEISNMDIRVMRTREQIAQTSLLEGELEMTEVQKLVTEKGLEIYAHRVAMAEAQKETMEEQLDATLAMQIIEQAIGELRQDERAAQFDSQIASIDRQESASLLRLVFRLRRLETELTMSALEDGHQPVMDWYTNAATRRRGNAAHTGRMAALEAARIQAAANILTTMTHSIGKVE